MGGLLVEVDVQASNSILVTKRNLKYSTSLFLGTMLGSIFGIFGTVGLLLNFAESAQNFIVKRKLLKEKIERLKGQREFISTNFDREKIKANTSRTINLIKVYL